MRWLNYTSFRSSKSLGHKRTKINGGFAPAYYNTLDLSREFRHQTINTGFHVDNLGGNSYLIAQGIPVYGSEMTVQLLAERGEATRVYMLDWLQGARRAKTCPTRAHSSPRATGR